MPDSETSAQLHTLNNILRAERIAWGLQSPRRTSLGSSPILVDVQPYAAIVVAGSVEKRLSVAIYGQDPKDF